MLAGRRYRPRTSRDSRARFSAACRGRRGRRGTRPGRRRSSSSLRQRGDMVLMRMDAARRQQADQMRGAAAFLQLGDELAERLVLGERSRPRPPGRCAADPASRRGRRRDSCGRLRNCPSGRSAGRRRSRSPRAGHAGSRAGNGASSAPFASATQLSARSRRSPQPSRMHRTTGRGRLAAPVGRLTASHPAKLKGTSRENKAWRAASATDPALFRASTRDHSIRPVSRLR